MINRKKKHGKWYREHVGDFHVKLATKKGLEVQEKMRKRGKSGNSSSSNNNKRSRSNIANNSAVFQDSGDIDTPGYEATFTIRRQALESYTSTPSITGTSFSDVAAFSGGNAMAGITSGDTTSPHGSMMLHIQLMG